MKFSNEAGIPGLWDISVLIISETCIDTVCLSLPQYRPGEPVSVSGCDTCIGYFADRLERPEHWLRSGTGLTGLTGQDFGDLRVCLRHYTLD